MIELATRVRKFWLSKKAIIEIVLSILLMWLVTK
nr:MAG TPA: hypothetical protein [Caudoviricetes sp.]